MRRSLLCSLINSVSVGNGRRFVLQNDQACLTCPHKRQINLTAPLGIHNNNIQITVSAKYFESRMGGND